jgi:PIN domain nuclease of toxin-antitoxin system
MILLDTCALIWIVNKDPITPAALALAERAFREGELYLSPVSAWEIGMLASRGRLKLDCSAESYVTRAFTQPGVRLAALTPEIAVRSSSLPGDLHGDPVDRMLVATAIVMGLRLITRDRRILEYGAAGHLSVIGC